jgi:N utilization substance protein A
MNNFNVVEALGQIAREKNVDREMVVQTLADALVSAAKRRYGDTENYTAEIDPTSGQMEVVARKIVVEEVVEPSAEISLDDARALESGAQLGSEIIERLDFADFGRNAIQTAKQILIQRVREAEREQIFEEFRGRTGQIESGIVQQISRGDIILTLGRAEAAVPFKEQIRRERYRQGDAIRGYIYEVLASSRGPQVLLSRTHGEYLRKLFAIEVPEISEGIVDIHAVAREPGERAKIAVSSHDERVDPVGACVGIKGSRVQAIVRELSGERIDIVPWSEEPEIFISRALSPASVARVILDNRRHHSTVIVDEDQLSLAIGRSGQNSRLAAHLTGWGLDIITDREYQNRRLQIELSQHHLRKLLGVSELIALSLATSGFISVASIAEAEESLLKTVPGLEEDGVAANLNAKAAAYVDEHGTDEDMVAMPESTEADEEGSTSEAESDPTGSVEDAAYTDPAAADRGEPLTAIAAEEAVASAEPESGDASETAPEGVEQPEDATPEGDDPTLGEVATDSTLDGDES